MVKMIRLKFSIIIDEGVIATATTNKNLEFDDNITSDKQLVEVRMDRSYIAKLLITHNDGGSCCKTIFTNDDLIKHISKEIAQKLPKLGKIIKN